LSDLQSDPEDLEITSHNSDDNRQHPDSEKVFDNRKIRKGLFLFITISIAALTGIFLYTNTGDTMGALKHIQVKFILLVFVLSLLDMTLGALRNHIFFVKLKKSLKFSVSFRANLANIFMGAVTPSQSGGGPAQIYVYYRAGVSVGKSISVSILNYLATLIFFVGAAGYSLHVLSDSFSETMHNLVLFCFFVFLIQLFLFIFIVWKPDLAIAITDKLAEKLTRWFPTHEERISRISGRLVKEVTAYKSSCRLFLKEHPHIPVLAVFITCVLYLNKFILAYFILEGLGVSADLTTVLSIQALVLFISYFSPSPGASGIAELSIAALMVSVMTEDLLGVFTLLQRFFILYIPVILGAFVVADELRNSTQLNNTRKD